MDMIHTASQSGKQEKEEKNEGVSTEDRMSFHFGVFFFTSWITTRETHQMYLSSVLSLLSALLHLPAQLLIYLFL